MANYIFLFAITVLLFINLWLLVYFKKKKSEYEEMMEDFETEAVASLYKVENEHQLKKKELVRRVKENYKAKITDFKEYIHSVEKISRTKSEVYTHTILTDLKKKLVSKGTIKPLQMIILSNIFLPFKSDHGQTRPTKIDHLVLMKTGIYIIDTNEFNGNILYGITKERAREFSFLLDKLYPSEENETEKTLVFENTNADKIGLNVYTVANPAEKVMAGVASINQLLNKHIDNHSITPILYFDHHSNSVINYSKVNTPYVFDNKKALSNFFIKQLEVCNYIHSEDELEKMKSSIQNVSII